MNIITNEFNEPLQIIIQCLRGKDSYFVSCFRDAEALYEWTSGQDAAY